MGDTHFLLQNTLSGLVFIFFGLCGIWFFNEGAAYNLVTLFLKTSQWQALAVLLFSPFFGIIVQGAGRLFRYKVLQRNSYEAEPRKIVADVIRRALISVKTIDNKFKIKIMNSPDDSLFVWFYYLNAPQHLIEWERRRRDIQQLGENWLAATMIGLTLGATLGLLDKFQFLSSSGFLRTLFILILLVWMLGMLLMIRKLKEEVDAMDLIWVLAKARPEIEEKIKQ